MKKKTEEKREAILAIAIETFGELGFEKTSMSEISSRLGGSKATLYNYFKSKEELFFETIHEAIESEIQSVYDTLHTNNEKMSETLYCFGDKFLHFIYSHSLKEARKLSITASAHTELGHITYTKGVRKSYETLAAFLENGISLGIIKPCDSFIAAQHFFALLEAETLMPFLMNVKTAITSEEIHAISQRAVGVFLKAYDIQ